MVVVVGTQIWDIAARRPAGRAAGIAIAAARNGAGVQVVDRVGSDAEGDALLLELARLGVGHVAVLRDATSPTRTVADRIEAQTVLEDGAHDDQADPVISRLEAADVELALRYLTAATVIVVTEDAPAAVADVANEAAAFAAAHLVLLTVADGSATPLAPAATVLAAPAPPHAGGFDELVGRYAAALDSGVPAREALRDAFRTLQIPVGA